jgi:S-adenosylmethionine decarboxylase
MSGLEWVVDAQGCSSESLRNLDILRALFDKIIVELRLRPVGETQWHQFPGSRGITGLCLLSESHLACHTFPEYGSLCLNLFCCVPRPEWNFESHLAEIFSATSVQVRTISRSYSEGDALPYEPALQGSCNK